jgi:hypothetical protein
MFTITLILIILMLGGFIALGMAFSTNVSLENRLIRLAASAIFGTLFFLSINSDYVQGSRDKMLAEREQAQIEDNRIGETKYPPKLITTVKGCEIWEFYMNGGYNHFLAKCPDSATVTYPIGKNATQSISTEIH